MHRRLRNDGFRGRRAELPAHLRPSEILHADASYLCRTCRDPQRHVPLTESDSESSGTDAPDIAVGRGRGRSGGGDRLKALVDKLQQANADLRLKLKKARRAATVARQNYNRYRDRVVPPASGMTVRASTAAASADSGDAAAHEVRPTPAANTARRRASCTSLAP